MSSPPPRDDAEHPIPPPPSPPLTEMVFPKAHASEYSNARKAAFTSPQRSPPRDHAPPPSPPLTEMVFPKPHASEHSKARNAAFTSPQRSPARDHKPPPSPPLTEMVSPKPYASLYSNTRNAALSSLQPSPPLHYPPPPSPRLTEISFPKPRASDYSNAENRTMHQPPRSPPHDDAEHQIPPPPSPPKSQSLEYSDMENVSMSSSQRSQLGDGAEHPITPSPSPPVPAMRWPKPLAPERNEELMASPNLSPLRLMKGSTPLPPLSPLPPPPHNTPEKAASPAMPVAAMAVASRLSREDSAVVAKVVGGGGTGVTGVVGGGRRGGGGRAGERESVAMPKGVRREEVWTAALGLRIAALVFSLIAFSVMAADKTQGWDGDSFDRYEEYRFLVAVNVIAFVYSGFQAYAKLHHRITKKHILLRPMRHYFNLSMDQILSYLLMSASSAAASRNDIWVSRFNGDEFTHKVDGSVAMSFLAFLALAMSSVISAYNLFKLGS